MPARTLQPLRWQTAAARSAALQKYIAEQRQLIDVLRQQGLPLQAAIERLRDLQTKRSEARRESMWVQAVLTAARAPRRAPGRPAPRLTSA